MTASDVVSFVSSLMHTTPDTFPASPLSVSMLAALPNRELDALAAQHVMGWRWATMSERVAMLLNPHDFAESVRPGLGWTPGIEPDAERDLEGERLNSSSAVPRYERVPLCSTDITRAFRLCEYAPTSTLVVEGSSASGWIARVNAQRTIHCNGTTPARAITAAFIRATQAGMPVLTGDEVFRIRLGLSAS